MIPAQRVSHAHRAGNGLVGDDLSLQGLVCAVFTLETRMGSGSVDREALYYVLTVDCIMLSHLDFTWLPAKSVQDFADFRFLLLQTSPNTDHTRSRC